MQGAFLRANANISRTLDGPTPTNISKNSEPETVINGTLASPAVAFASRVLPVPGGPVNIAPLDIVESTAHIQIVVNWETFRITADEDKVAQAMKTCSSSLLQCKNDNHLLNDPISESALHLHLNISNVSVAVNRSITSLVEKENMLTILDNEQSRYQG
uniref:Uncharacterized protein n=1 Tax=Glossina pallidipes TaxID=7398 RepID=A0A1B0AG37_GLOPL